MHARNYKLEICGSPLPPSSHPFAIELLALPSAQRFPVESCDITFARIDPRLTPDKSQIPDISHFRSRAR